MKSLAYVIFEIDTWKSEFLFRYLQNDPDIYQCIYIIDHNLKCYNKDTLSIQKKDCINYCIFNQYRYKVLKKISDLKKEDFDYIFLPKNWLYEICMDEDDVKFIIDILSKSIYLHYAYHRVCIKSRSYISEIHKKSKINIFENYQTLDDYSKFFHIKNGFVTGYPFSTYLLENNGIIQNDKLKILYSPHWTGCNEKLKSHVVNKSLFYSFYKEIMDCFDKYQNYCDFIIKPHPEWFNNIDKNIFNYIQSKYPVVSGNYVDLFKQTDAIIHDCGSFTIEYCHMKKPCCLLEFTKNDYLQFYTRMGKDAYNLHIKANNIIDIENYIKKNLDKKIDTSNFENFLCQYNMYNNSCELIRSML